MKTFDGECMRRIVMHDVTVTRGDSKMELEDIKRGLRAEIKKRENEQYATFQCNVRQMCKDVLAKLEEQESAIAEKDEELRHHKYKRCLAMAQILEHVCPLTNRKAKWRDKWHKRWLELAEKFKEAK